MIAELEVWAPLCMDAGEWREWQELNPRLTRQSDQASRPCADCPISFAREMRALGRCNGTPGMTDTKEDTVAEDLTTLDVVSMAPCRRCAHQNVCAMRPKVEGLRRLDVVLPDLPKAVRVIVTAEVECGEFLRQGRSTKPVTSVRISEAVKASWTPERRQAASDRAKSRPVGIIAQRKGIDTSPEAREARAATFDAGAQELAERDS